MEKDTVKLTAKKTMREIASFIKDEELTKDNIIQIVFGDGNWYLIYQK